MKWLFAVLVALNIIVFGSMVAYRTQHKTVKPESALEGSTHELLRPSSLDAPKAEPQPGIATRLGGGRIRRPDYGRT